MLQINDKILSEDILTECFCCDIELCGGVCCVHGDSGAPLEPDDHEMLQRELPHFAPYLSPQGREVVAQQGVAVVDKDGDLVTPLVPHNEECAYAYFDDDGTCRCAIEQAYLAGKTSYRKPMSCHLYPIRVRKMGDNIALNYHRWAVCQCARDKGCAVGMPVYRFLREPIVRRFGEAFYNELKAAAELLQFENLKI
jgi:hypothetical protein